MNCYRPHHSLWLRRQLLQMISGFSWCENMPYTFNLSQWLSGCVLDSGPRGRGFEPYQRHGLVVFEQDTFILA